MSKIALVTGGTRGIGESISKLLNANNYKVIASYNSNDDAANKFSEINNIEIMKWDVSSFDESKSAIEKIKSNYNKIDILINNAGITKDAPLHNMKK